MSAQVNPPTPPTAWGSFTQALRTFFNNSFGSDTLTAYTAEYAWLSNQMAHAMMGFFLAALWAFAVSNYHWSWVCVWMPLSIPVLKEITDYFLDAGFRLRPFHLNHFELFADAVTDVFFWSFGMLLAIGMFGFDGVNWLVLLTTVAVGVPTTLGLLFWAWLPRMRRFDFSRMPFNYVRLVKYSHPERLLAANELEKVRQFQQLQVMRGARDDKAVVKPHLILAGGGPMDRSRLAVSLGCEFIARWQGVYMISAVKLLEDPNRLTNACEMAKQYKMSVRCLIVDDLSVNLPIPRELDLEQRGIRRETWAKQPETADPGQMALQKVQERVEDLIDVFEKLRETFTNTCTIWVLTGGPADSERLRHWKTFIANLVTGKDDPTYLTEIHLSIAPAGANEGK